MLMHIPIECHLMTILASGSKGNGTEDGFNSSVLSLMQCGNPLDLL